MTIRKSEKYKEIARLEEPQKGRTEAEAALPAASIV